MSRTTRSLFKASAYALSLAAVGLFSAAAQAASINYGNHGAFQQVTESSVTDAVPLYGAPTAFVGGLDFNPVGFASSSSGGGADVTLSELTFSTSNLGGINSVSVFESGDYTLVGVGGAPTEVTSGAFLSATVTEVNGVAVAPIPLTPVSASFSDTLPGAAIVAPWSLNATLNVVLPAGQKATKIDVSISNSLTSSSEAGTAAIIAKKEFIVNVSAVPEPGAAALAGLALCSLGLVRRKS